MLTQLLTMTTTHKSPSLGVAGQAGVAHRLDQRVLLQPSAHLQRVALMLLHAHAQRLERPVDQVAVEGAGVEIYEL